MWAAATLRGNGVWCTGWSGTGSQEYRRGRDSDGLSHIGVRREPFALRTQMTSRSRLRSATANVLRKRVQRLQYRDIFQRCMEGAMGWRQQTCVPLVADFAGTHHSLLQRCASRAPVLALSTSNQSIHEMPSDSAAATGLISPFRDR